MLTLYESLILMIAFGSLIVSLIAVTMHEKK